MLKGREEGRGTYSISEFGNWVREFVLGSFANEGGGGERERIGCGGFAS